MFSFPCPILPSFASDRGMSTAEYAMCTVAAVTFAGALILILGSEPVSSALRSIITDALQTRT
jgi:hypothetical protein